MTVLENIKECAVTWTPDGLTIHILDDVPYTEPAQNPTAAPLWREDPATDKQKAFLVTNSIPFKKPISKGEASEKINRYVTAHKRARR